MQTLAVRRRAPTVRKHQYTCCDDQHATARDALNEDARRDRTPHLRSCVGGRLNVGLYVIDLRALLIDQQREVLKDLVHLCTERAKWFMLTSAPR